MKKQIDKPVLCKIRRYWSRNPVTRVHSTRHGKKGYLRTEKKQMDRRLLKENWEE